MSTASAGVIGQERSVFVPIPSVNSIRNRWHRAKKHATPQREPLRFYAVVNRDTRAEIYVGTSMDFACEHCLPGTTLGIGDDAEAALADARAKSFRFLADLEALRKWQRGTLRDAAGTTPVATEPAE